MPRVESRLCITLYLSVGASFLSALKGVDPYGSCHVFSLQPTSLFVDYVLWFFPETPPTQPPAKKKKPTPPSSYIACACVYFYFCPPLLFFKISPSLVSSLLRVILRCNFFFFKIWDKNCKGEEGAGLTFEGKEFVEGKTGCSNNYTFHSVVTRGSIRSTRKWSWKFSRLRLRVSR